LQNVIITLQKSPFAHFRHFRHAAVFPRSAMVAFPLEAKVQFCVQWP